MVQNKNYVYKRNGILSLIKFVFGSMIVIMHYSMPFRGSYFAEGGYLFVDFFFILQGFFLIGNRVKNTHSAYDAAKSYLKVRLQKFFPCVFTSAILMALVCAPTITGLKDVVRRVIAFFCQITFISQLLPRNMLEYGGIFWFLSASIVAGTFWIFAYGAIKENIYPFCILFSAMAYSWIFNTRGSTDTWHIVLGGYL